MGQSIWTDEEGWSVVIGSSTKSHYFTKGEIEKGTFPMSLCGKVISGDIRPEEPDRPVQRCKTCQRKVSKL